MILENHAFALLLSMIDSNSPQKPSDEHRISSGDLAAIVVDVGIVQKKDISRALGIATDKIEGRKELRDY